MKPEIRNQALEIQLESQLTGEIPADLDRMSHSINQTIDHSIPLDEPKVKEFDSDVLYQKMGDQWYAFAQVDGEVFMSRVTPDAIDRIRGRET